MAAKKAKKQAKPKKPKQPQWDMSEWHDVIGRLGDERRQRQEEINSLVAKMEAAGGPQSPEEWAFYYQNRKVPVAEQNAYDESGTDWLTECFRKAIEKAQNETAAVFSAHAGR